MSLQTIEPKTSAQLLARLTEVEKIAIRKATPDALEHMRQTRFISDAVTPEVMAQTAAALEADFTSFSEGPFWARQTWNF
jgi:hypothetical protein